ncbi:hypothetical protein RFI_07710 [Reticulomyxa filosa]|uniref:IQ motif and ubiquitin-like domain-containing protein n=1 Tax=Reticulomyxa filosa TaxID=46433 RepID=X6NT13_RETFI|nr:hypothetical protein RFI_07710 [Reticulomyxa filosa]|eukprot:ETO29410.1 hypothetical protein RFI_07710 [Reticulomyxa filosa]
MMELSYILPGRFQEHGTSIEYHDCQTQTLEPTQAAKVHSKNIKKAEIGGKKNKINKSTQTWKQKNSGQQTARDNGTQMKRNDLFLDETKDFSIVCGPYFDSEKLLQLQQTRKTTKKGAEDSMCSAPFSCTETCIKIKRKQKFKSSTDTARSGAIARTHALKKSKQRWSALQQIGLNKGSEDQIQNRFVAQSHSGRGCTKNKDGYVQRIKQLKEAHQLHVAQEKHKQKVLCQKKKREFEELLDKMASPNQWILNNGTTLSVDTPATRHASLLVDIYKQLSLSINKYKRAFSLAH